MDKKMTCDILVDPPPPLGAKGGHYRTVYKHYKSEQKLNLQALFFICTYKAEMKSYTSDTNLKLSFLLKTTIKKN